MATEPEKPSVELHVADPKKLASVVAFIEGLSEETLTPEEIEELRMTIDGSPET